MNTSIKNLIWWLFTSLTFVFFTYSVYAFDSINYILKTDMTFISFFILGLYFVTTIILGIAVVFKNMPDNFDKFWFISDSMTDFGLIGTIIGLAITFSLFIFGEGITDQNLDVVSSKIAEGVGAAVTTTLVGLICSRFLKIQLSILEK